MVLKALRQDEDRSSRELEGNACLNRLNASKQQEESVKWSGVHAICEEGGKRGNDEPHGVAGTHDGGARHWLP